MIDLSVVGVQTCPSGQLNMDKTCSTTPQDCFNSPRIDVYLIQSLIQNCPNGTVANSDWTDCVPCRLGTFADGRPLYRQSLYPTAAAACPPGSFSNTSGMSACLLCQPGSYRNESGATSCESCTAGSECPGYGSSRPTACRPGSFSDTSGRSSCLLCPISQVAGTSGRWSCDVCDSTQHMISPVAGGSACRYCEGVALASSQCQACGLGNYYDNVSQACGVCQAGTTNEVDIWAIGSSSCVRCASPTAYAPTAGLGRCIEAPPGFLPSADSLRLEACGVGRYRSSNMSTCSQCAPGSFTAQLNSSICSLCAVGTFASGDGSTRCGGCAVGSVASVSGSSTCTLCAAGSESIGASQCQQCKANYRSTGGTGCLPCDLDKVSSPGSSSCAYCPLGQAAVGSSGGCGPCPPGRYMSQNGEYSTCRTCNGNGQYIPFSGAVGVENCTVCSPGLTVKSDGTGCKPCNNGYYADNTFTCTACNKSTYGANGTCVACPPGQYGVNMKQTACVLCQPGLYNGAAGLTTCQACGVGTFSAVAGQSSCQTCVGGFAPRPGLSACQPRRTSCDPGYFVNRTADPTSDNVCVPCTICGSSEIPILDQQYMDPANWSQAVIDTALQGDRSISMCPGNTFSAGFLCLSTSASIKGSFLNVDTSLATAGDGLSVSDAGYTTNLSPCSSLSAHELDLVDWVSGPKMWFCYIGCRYGVVQAEAQRYVSQFAQSDNEVLPYLFSFFLNFGPIMPFWLNYNDLNTRRRPSRISS